MKKLYEILGQDHINGDVGIEIEVEGYNLPDAVDRRWVATHDGSLRGDNREYVLRRPLPIEEVHDALTCLKINCEKAKAVMDFSFRTSVHVHVNCQELTYQQYLNFLYTYLIMEEVLMNFCGKERKGNRFCLRVQDAEGMLEVYHKLFVNGEEAIFNIPRDNVRYSAMNVEATTKYGSVEFRGMEGNMDADRISIWAKALVAIREFAKSMVNPYEIYQILLKTGGKNFVQEVLKDLYPHFAYARIQKDVQTGFSLSIELPNAYKKAQDVVQRAVSKAPRRIVKPKEHFLIPHDEFFNAAVVIPRGFLNIEEAPN